MCADFGASAVLSDRTKKLEAALKETNYLGQLLPR